MIKNKFIEIQPDNKPYIDEANLPSSESKVSSEANVARGM
jgi:hypothetical protein